MKWTKEKPTEEGWYWWHDKKNGYRERCVDLICGNRGIYLPSWFRPYGTEEWCKIPKPEISEDESGEFEVQYPENCTRECKYCECLFVTSTNSHNWTCSECRNVLYEDVIDENQSES